MEGKSSDTFGKLLKHIKKAVVYAFCQREKIAELICDTYIRAHYRYNVVLGISFCDCQLSYP